MPCSTYGRLAIKIKGLREIVALLSFPDVTDARFPGIQPPCCFMRMFIQGIFLTNRVNIIHSMKLSK
ncbi:hypothetical protein HEAR0445 [Herminiimonas arsenicoxydans]|uniref:Uncharacterized protein n=1 Tax=Herminiimonas arsenicoxydans TaxID=204773 RepID=A4G2C4_HERAR|nr:hypothetical protein HEAR0445 [Herminiimonas arsenicoxydans]